MPFAIEVHRLTKTYGPVRAVDAIDLQVRPGEIYGFLGLNGAGKTTTIRAMLGMIHPDAGAIRVLGHNIAPGAQAPWGQVGYMVESPAAYPELTVRENLEVARRWQQINDKTRIAQVIEQLALTPYADRKAGTLSTGNTQRLGLARALLHQPSLLILDEPANGLDPAGIVEIRDLLATLVKEAGVTVFMSSHILAEVDRIATRIGIIHEGCLIKELDADQLAAIRAKRLTIRARDLSAAHRVLTQAGLTLSVRGDTLLVADQSAIDAPDEVATLLANQGTPPLHLTVEQEELEDYFLRLTGAN